MRTDDLVAVLSRDAAMVSPWWRRPSPVIASGAAAAAAAFAIFLPVRGDLLAASGFGPTMYKWLLACILALVGGSGVLRLRRPDADASPFWTLAGLLAAFAVCSLAYDLWSSGASGSWERLAGSSAFACLRSIGWLSLAPLAAFLAVLRAGAVTSPCLAGATAGFAAAGIGAFLYALKCTEDSALFVVTWYGLSAVILAAIAALLGHWLLRW
jgi:hypothetical protein